MSAPAEGSVPPCVVFEDEDLLVVCKPPGWNTHAPAPFAGEGIHDWLKHREPRWARLAIVHRLDKDTSGLMVFGKTPEANRSLTEQFARRQVTKRYVLVTDRPAPRERFSCVNTLLRVGDRYEVGPPGAAGDRAETRFRVLRREKSRTWLEAEPVTGRTHQIRVHAASEGLPILGDRLYGGGPAIRLHLHSAHLEFRHPRSGGGLQFDVEPDFIHPVSWQLRRAIIHPDATDAFRWRQGAADGCADLYVDRLGERWLVHCGHEPTGGELKGLDLEEVESANFAPSLYLRRLERPVRTPDAAGASPRLLQGCPAPDRFVVRENGVHYELSFAQGGSTGLFLDQRDNRRRLLTGHIASGFPLRAAGSAVLEVLNCFAYTCAFSVCAALGGARATSLDLSRKYLDWGRRNFALNKLDPAAHDFIYGDVFDWLQRLAKKSRTYSMILLDPPTFSRSREQGDFRAEADFGALVSRALPLLCPDGVLFASTNAARLGPDVFLQRIRAAIAAAGRRILQEHYVPQPPDFPITREEPAHLKTVWLRVSA